MKILLIEDNPGDARFIKEILKEVAGDFTIDVEEKLGTGLEFLASQAVDAVLLDLGLPDSRGLETLTRLQTRFSHLPVVIMTSIDDESLGAQAVQRGAQDYMAKGNVNGELLKRTLAHAIERKRTEKALRESEERLVGIVNSAMDAVISVDEQQRIRLFNPAAQQMFGLSAAEVIGQPLARLIPERFRRAHENHIRNFAQTGVTARRMGALGEISGLHANGEEFPIEASISEITVVGGKIFTVILRDITERKRAEETLRESEQRFRDLADAMPQLVWTARPDGRVDYYNNRHQEYLGFRQTSDRTYHWAPVLHPDDRQFTVEAWQHAFATGETYEVEHRVQRADGSFRWLLSRGVPVRDEHGRIIKWYGTATDVHELREAREALARSHAELEHRVEQRTAELTAANRELEAFSYSVSHDLRAPLRHVMGFIKLLDQSAGASLDEESRRYVQTIAEAAQRMGSLIDDLLAFSRIGRAQMTETAVSLRTLVDEARRELASETAGRNIEWHIGALPDIRADPELLRSAVVNLLSNAIKYTRHRDPARIEIGCGEQDGETVCFVRDNGAGFDMRFADKLFGVFQRLHRAEEFEGTGIGLANVRRIIQRHGGRIWAQAEVERGATVYFSLPNKELSS